MQGWIPSGVPNKVIGQVKGKFTDITPLAWVRCAAKGKSQGNEEEVVDEDTCLHGHGGREVETSIGCLDIHLGCQDGLIGVACT
jgi:hypothetical protein